LQWWLFFSFGCSAGGTPSASSAQATNSGKATCSQSHAVIDIGIGWTIEEARAHSPALAHIAAAPANWAPAAYVYAPERVKLEGAIPLEIPCPHMVVVTPKDGRVSGVDIDLTPTDNLDAAMKLMGEWHRKFESMKLDPPPAASARLDESPAQVREFFRSQGTLSPFGPIGGSIGSWCRGQEVIGVGIEKRNIGSIKQPRYIYVVELNISDVSMWISK
jgi:hypothetical protein